MEAQQNSTRQEGGVSSFNQFEDCVTGVKTPLTASSSSREMETICRFGLRPDLTEPDILSTKCLDFSS